MRWSSIWSEALRNLVSGTSRALTWVLVLSCVTGVSIIAELFQAHDVTVAARTYVNSGASITVLDSPGHIDGLSCEALNSVDGVRAAGALRHEQEQRLTLSALPSAPIPLASVTASFPQVLHADVSPLPGVILSDQITKSVPASPGSVIATADGDVTVAGLYSYPDDGRAAGYGYLVLTPTTAKEAFDECWVDIWPQNEATQNLIYMALIPSDPSDSKPTQKLQLNTTLGASFSGQAQFDSRITRFLPVIVGTVALIIGFLSVRTRRLEFASALHAGVSRKDMRRIIACECGTWIGASVLVNEAITWITIAALGAYSDGSLAVLAHRMIWAALVGACAGVTLAWLATREKQLFRYFKNR
ncbi:hypothetical protein G7Y41_03040 [Schaalia sp. ZJ405]|uniref:hypothetical protein n=1 Tax=Schaalia sp. ZJ405 TaxID=2709403 RepID=UPI0013E9BA6C|nr:hypothetical protein [Schaalia sp. ZJ405]QPK81814.1 hypothetical protein G7Y41_03040 [Schaalia sp. ZJ405]